MPKLTDAFGRPYSGVQSHAVPALVVDNEDPDSLGRIKVKFPTLPTAEASDGVTSFWLRQATPNGGSDRGLYALPEVGDEVIVLFLFGSQDLGVIIGQFWNGVDTPPVEANKANEIAAEYAGNWSTGSWTEGSGDHAANDRRLWKSRSGHLIVFDDTDGSESVHIWDKTRQLGIILDSATGAIIIQNGEADLHIRTKNDLYLDAGNDIKIVAGNEIVVESTADTTWDSQADFNVSAASNVAISSGAETGIEAGSDFKVKATASVAIEASTTAEVKGGAGGTFDGGASLTLKAGSVAIN